MMQQVSVKDGAVVLVMTKLQAEALKRRLELRTGVIMPATVEHVIEKLNNAMDEE